MRDYIIRAITKNGHIRAFAAVTTNLVEQARVIHNTTPVATAALGRTLTIASMMGIMLKGEEDVLTIQIKGKGELGGLVVIADSSARVKGYVYNPQADIPLRSDGKLDVGGVIGKGYLNVIKDIGLKEPYGGQVPLVSGEIGEDFAYYFSKSEQINSAVGLGVLIEKDYSVDVAGGFIIQVMPDIEEDEIKELEETISNLQSITDLFKKYSTPEEVLKNILKSFEIDIMDKIDTNYVCNCNKSRMEKALISIGFKDLKEIIDEQGEAQLTCHFCSNNYLFTKEELENLLKECRK